MAVVQNPTVVELADQLSEGFVALSGEYQLLFAQHRQLESKLSFAKQQVILLFSFYLSFVMIHFSSRSRALLLR